ncbi:TadE/TadG family type IV pilus assembly protein [Alteraurantiacibacter buctensis]|uniref:Pilus assembly protein n=1 Tax=Alteraurantiacibacter buctensis TaxID=1503981 RepID=A0A844Z0K0_9SPHN|nr:TadE/TadG family type IV pilus assembly protein [Alteraurantiacibacter buctensis]MXO72234.1 pilus assembly protein [Alteraurantiacibacter buctensis]
MMRRALSLLRRALRCQAGSMAIETAIIAPVLIALSIGGFEIGSIVARQTELQSAAAEAAAIVRAATPATSEERTAIRDVVATSTGLSTGQVSVTEIYRCADATAYVTSEADCSTGVVINKFIRLAIADTYHPLWAEFGIGSELTFDVTRTVQVG